MRGRIAAACAALLVGLAPAGVLLSTPWLAADSLACDELAPAREARAAQSAALSLAEQAPRATPRFFALALAAPIDLAEEAPLIWRSPSGPAPSTAPPFAS